MKRFSEEQADLAQADLLERIARAVRSRSVARPAIQRALEYADLLPRLESEQADYRSALAFLGVLSPEREAAVLAILRGEHPPDSLAGKVEQKREAAINAAKEQRGPLAGFSAARLKGRALALGEVLDLLGCKVPST